MTKNTYEARAMKFASYLCRLFADCLDLGDFENVIDEYNMTHSRMLHYAHGVSRIAIIRADYVIKFDLKPSEEWDDGRAGDNGSEAAVYARAVHDGYEYLLAKSTVCLMGGRTITIMPRVDHVNDYSRSWYATCSDDEIDWLESNVNDLHEGNVGYRHGKVCVVDYAWDVAW